MVEKKFVITLPFNKKMNTGYEFFKQIRQDDAGHLSVIFSQL